MSHLTFVTRAAASGALVFFTLASACGGASTSSGGGPTGGTASVGGSGSGGGSGAETCTAAPDPGPCNAYLPSWYHDARTGICRPFAFGGCGGNANRYSSLAECQEACRGLGSNYDGCSAPNDCVIASAGCCDVCDTQSVSTRDFIAYNRMFQPHQPCGGAPLTPPGPDEPDVPTCPGCTDIEGGYLRYFVPECVQTECVVTDLRDGRFTACMSDADCGYRIGTGCCQSCDSAEAIPLRKDAEVGPLLCAGTGPVACAPCPTVEPSTLPRPVCGPDQRCALTFPAVR